MPLGIVKPEEFNKELGLSDTSINPKEFPNEPPIQETEQEVVIEPKVITEVESKVEAEVVTRASVGRGLGDSEVPESIRKLIGESAIEEGRPAALAIGKFLGLSESSVSAYTRGATSTATYHKPEKELNSFLNGVRHRIQKRAAGKLFKSLDAISDEKLSELNAFQASSVARNMSTIVKDMEPEVNQGIHNQFNGPVITFYAPHMSNEDKFETITINE